MLMDMLGYGFIQRGMEAGIVIALIAPLIGTFLVLKRYSLIADTLSHVSFAGIAIGILLRIDPIVTAIFAAVLASFGIEKLKGSRRIYGESVLGIFLSGSLAVAIVLLGLDKSVNANLISYLFGSIVTVTSSQVIIMTALAVAVVIAVRLMWRDLIYSTFDEEGAAVSGVAVSRVNAVFIVLSALTVALSIPVVGVLLISALIVIPAVTALQLRLDIKGTILIAELISVVSVISGILCSYWFDLPSGGAIVLVMLVFFGMVTVAGE